MKLSVQQIMAFVKDVETLQKCVQILFDHREELKIKDMGSYVEAMNRTARLSVELSKAEVSIRG